MKMGFLDEEEKIAETSIIDMSREPTIIPACAPCPVILAPRPAGML